MILINAFVVILQTPLYYKYRTCAPSPFLHHLPTLVSLVFMPHFAVEGGRHPLAQELFDTFKNRIRCTTCPGNKGSQGFTLDSAGKCSRDGQPRRYFSCQFSKAAGSEASCRRASCTRYIQLAYEQLKPTEFVDVVKRVQARFEEGSEYYQALATYLTGKPSDAFFKQFCVSRTQPTSGSFSSDDSPVALADRTPLALKRKAESLPVEHSQGKRACVGPATDKKALVVKELTAVVDDFSIVLKTRLTAICDILYSTEIDLPPPTSDTVSSLNTPGPLTPPSPVSPVEVVKREKARALVAEFWNADRTRRKHLRNQAKAEQVFSYFEDEIQKGNIRRQAGLEDRIRQH